MIDAPANSRAVELHQVSRLYGSFAAMREVSLTIEPGSSVLLLGPNGAGKSTLLKIIAGLVSPTFGSVQVFGSRPADVRHRLAYMSHAPMLYDELTSLENLRYFAALHAACCSLPPGSGVLPSPEQALTEVGLDPHLQRRFGDYSQGMRQRASLARALLTIPELLLLDEPFSNLDAASSHTMVTRLQAWMAEPSPTGRPRTLVLTTHQAELARPLAQITLTLHAGRLEEEQFTAVTLPALHAQSS